MAKETAYFSEDFSRAVRLFRYKKEGMTQKKISETVGFPNSALSQYLGGKQKISIHDSRIDRIKKLIKFNGNAFEVERGNGSD